MSNTEKLERLSSLINSSGGEVAEEDFKEILNTLPVELVSFGRDLKGIFSKLKQKRKPTRCLKKTSFCQKWLWQILLLTVRNKYETLANTSKTPSPSLTTSKCASTCDEFFPNCFVVFQARCCILLPKIVIPEQRCLQGRNSVSLSDPFLQWSSTGGGVPKTFCLGSRQILLSNFQM